MLLRLINLDLRNSLIVLICQFNNCLSTNLVLIIIILNYLINLNILFRFNKWLVLYILITASYLYIFLWWLRLLSLLFIISILLLIIYLFIKLWLNILCRNIRTRNELLFPFNTSHFLAQFVMITSYIFVILE